MTIIVTRNERTMLAHEKIHAFGEKRIADQTGRSLSVIYRWRKALQNGQRISERSMRELMKATHASAYALQWSDFEPNAVAELAA